MRVVRWSWWTLVAALLASAAGCAGRSVSNDGDDTGGTAAGGMSGGSTAAGGSSATGGATSPCAPKSRPGCNQTVFFVYLAGDNECIRAASSGCGNDTVPSFMSLEDCLDACPGSKPERVACDTDSDCVVAGTGCCAVCDPVSLDELTAVHKHRQENPNCGPIACNSCNVVPETERTSQYFRAVCNNHACNVSDIRDTPLTGCSEDSHCRLRDGSDCCEGCDGTGLVAVNSSEWMELDAERCREVACDECAPNIPPTYRAGCNDDGRCFVGQIPF